jgi:ubiquitin C-terminal hydrolase
MLTVFDEKNILDACALANNGSMCYLNSLVQGLLSCTSVTAFFLKHETKYTSNNNIVAIEFVRLIKEIKNKETTTLSTYRILEAIRTKDPSFGIGQEDSGESFHMFLKSINDDDLYKLFIHKYVADVWCISCEKQLTSTKDESCIFEIPKNFAGSDSTVDSHLTNCHPLNSYILHYISDLKDYACTRCNQQRCCRVYRLANVPNIITVMFNKFSSKNTIDFPISLSFPSHNSTTIDYKLVSKIEHSGNQSGGHYWSHCYRHSENSARVYMLNDTSVSNGDFLPTPEKYMLIYHVVSHHDSLFDLKNR